MSLRKHRAIGGRIVKSEMRMGRDGAKLGEVKKVGKPTAFVDRQGR